MRSDHRQEDEVEKPRRRKVEERHGHPDRGQPELHLVEDLDGHWEVWLNTGIADYDGIVIGTGPSRQAAIENAVGVAEWVEETLQGPPPHIQGVLDGEKVLDTHVPFTVRIEPPCQPTLRYIRYANREWQESAQVSGPWTRIEVQREVAP